MTCILNVERYSKKEHELVLDFTDGNEFYYFESRTGLGAKYKGCYLPSMIFIHNFPGKKNVREGAWIAVDLYRLVEFIKEHNADVRLPAVAIAETYNGSGFEDLIIEE